MFIKGQHNAIELDGFNMSTLLLPRQNQTTEFVDVLYNAQVYMDVDHNMP